MNGTPDPAQPSPLPPPTSRLTLPGADLQRLQSALLSAFPTQADLEQLVRFELNQNLAEIATGGNLTATVFSLLNWAAAHGKLEQLVDGARRQNPGNPDLAAFEFARTQPAAQSAAPAPTQTPASQLDLPPELLEASARGLLTLCIGDLRSYQQAAQAPEMARLLAQRIAYPDLGEAISDADAADVAQAYANERGMFNLITLVREQAQRAPAIPPDLLQAIAALPVNYIVTTDYGDELEQALQGRGRRTVSLVEDSSLPFALAAGDGVNLLKLRGELTRPQSLVLTREQFDGYFISRPQIQRLLENLLVQTTVLYLGWDFSEPQLSTVAAQLGPRLGALQRRSYAVVGELAPHQVRELLRRQIATLQLPPAADHSLTLIAWLNRFP